MIRKKFSDVLIPAGGADPAMMTEKINDNIFPVVIEAFRGMNETVRAEKSAKMQSFIDGNGTMRIADVIMREFVKLKCC